MSKVVLDIEQAIIEAYSEGVTMEVAEKLAAKTLHAQLLLSAALKNADLDSRMRKAGVKAVRAAIYMDGATKGDKKPSDVLLQAQVDMNELVAGEQKSFDEAEAAKDELERLYNVMREAHVFFRGVAKGNFNG